MDLDAAVPARLVVERRVGEVGGGEGCEFVIEVGASSRDIRLRTSIELPDDPKLPPLVPDEDLLATP